MAGNDDSTETLSADIRELVARPSQHDAALQLVLVWSTLESARIGETCVVNRPAILGRGPSLAPGDPPKLEFMRQRPGANDPTGSLQTPTLSRRQWRLEPNESEVEVTPLGKGSLFHNGFRVASCTAKVGDTIGVPNVALFLVAKRPRLLAGFEHESFEFGHADPDALVGETPELWRLRGELAHLGKSAAHVLVLGESGSGKELCASALHRKSVRRARPLVSRNAATIPTGLIEAELFGNAKNYPHPGMPARAGLIGEADGTTLFLDEVGELSELQQANLLRVLDEGEYQSLGEDRRRKSDLRVVAATNRPANSLKPDFLARLTEHLFVPNLDARRADVPLLARALMRRIQTDAAEQAPSFSLMCALVRHHYTSNCRELEKLLRLSQRHSRGPELELTEEVQAELELPSPRGEVSEQLLREALRNSSSSVEAARRLGLPSRFALYRVMKKFGLEPDAPKMGSRQSQPPRK